MLEANGVIKRFGGVTALGGVDLSLSKAEILGLIGPNGSGKTTLVNCVSGVCEIDGGEVLLNGRPVSGKRREQRARSGLARTFQNPRLFVGLTVRENVLAGGSASGDGATSTRNRVERLLDVLDLRDVSRDLVVNLPYGLQRRVEIARALAGEPSVLLLDEPAAGLNDTETTELVELLRDLQANQSLTMLVIDHDMNLITQASDRVQVLDEGSVIYVGDPAMVFKEPRVVEAYLGASGD